MSAVWVAVDVVRLWEVVDFVRENLALISGDFLRGIKEDRRQVACLVAISLYVV